MLVTGSSRSRSRVQTPQLLDNALLALAREDASLLAFSAILAPLYGVGWIPEPLKLNLAGFALTQTSSTARLAFDTCVGESRWFWTWSHRG